MQRKVCVQLVEEPVRFKGLEISGKVTDIVTEGYQKYVTIMTADGKSFNIGETNVKSWKIIR